ncbi:MAG: AraC family transcriptional regulator [Pedobacter sp.]|nr:MAG: AraC family transcriptional regulator [Pedobacter sp.]
MTSSENLVTQKEILELSFTNYLVKSFVAGNANEHNLLYRTSKNIIAIFLCIDGSYSLRSSVSKKTVNFKSAEANIHYIPTGEFSLTEIAVDTEILIIYMEEDFFFRQIPKDHVTFKNRNTQTFGSVYSKNPYINPKLKNVINEVISCEFTDHLRTLYIKAKAFELLTLLIAQHEEERHTNLKADEIEKMLEVKKLIDSNLNEAYTLAYLAKSVGTNEQYLKNHFKILQGQTVFGYILSCRMEKAKEMLLSGKYRITDIAELTGYRHATHFTTAFKKFFGYLPKTLKTKVLLSGYFSFNLDFELLGALMII